MIQLGEAWLSVERREAFLHGRPVRLGSRAFAILEVLLAAPNRLVTKDELITAIWPDSVVEENNLQVQISTLRRLLELDQQLLETVPRRGYRLNLGARSQQPVAAAPVPQPDADEAWKSQAHVHVVDDEPAVCAALVRLLRSMGIAASGHDSAAAFLAACSFERPACLLLDVRLSDGSGFDLLDELARRQAPMPIVFMTGFGTIDMSVRAMKAGAEGFLTKPVDEQQLLTAVREAMQRAHSRYAESSLCRSLQERYQALTERERQIFAQLLRGHLNKEIASELGLQEVTVKVHKKHIMTKLRTKTLVDLLMVGRALGMLPELHAEPA
ncbi:response regulator [Pseudomonas sp. Gutcm_11s]|uniref:response regulator n=1 Tax=Pseudomonas sp. Gutcm_11s TaxID=3026088 RepID=UPI00235DF5AB|nr:response regulator [Pseudomonas sp. Gutcm_11s]MDD0842720.1 response regulator [Pseudomonas sp. Gutcm_11s]